MAVENAPFLSWPLAIERASSRVYRKLVLCRLLQEFNRDMKSCKRLATVISLWVGTVSDLFRSACDRGHKANRESLTG